MKRTRAPLFGAFAVLGAATLWVGCGSSSDKGFTGSDASTGDDATASDAAPSDDGSTPVLVGDGEAGPPCFACSADLHQVLDCATPPHVLQTCPDDQGCGAGGQCVDACQAAADNQSSIGCDYYTIPADGWSSIPLNNASGQPSSGSCFAAFVNNTWGIPLKVSLEWKGTTIDATPFAYTPTGSGTNITYTLVPSGGIPPHQMAIVFLNQYGTANMYKALCPASVRAAIENEDVGLHGTGFGTALHLTTSAPAVVYDIFPYGGAASYISSATLLLPTPVWDTNYVAVSAWPGIGTNLPMDVEIVGMTDGTKVTLLPKADIAANGAVPAAPAGQAVTYTLNKGQLLQFAQIADLSGSPIQATNPVGVWGGHYCMTIPNQTTQACDAAHQQIPPVKALGSVYAAVRYRSRLPVEETVPWRIMGMVKGTTLTYDPPVSGAPATLDVGQLVEFSTSSPFVVKSQDDQHPFYLAAHMTGGSVAGLNAVGDPETVNVVTPAQFLSSYLFFTDPTYADTDLVVVRGPAPDGSYKDVKLDCLGSTPVPGFTSIGGSSYQYARVDLQQGHQPVGQCDNGLHTMWSDAPFGITVWGYDQYVSYAYPAGASVRPINNVVVPPQ